MKTMSNCSNGVAAASIPMLLTSLPSTNDYRNLSSERSARPLHDAYDAPGGGGRKTIASIPRRHKRIATGASEIGLTGPHSNERVHFLAMPRTQRVSSHA